MRRLAYVSRWKVKNAHFYQDLKVSRSYKIISTRTSSLHFVVHKSAYVVTTRSLKIQTMSDDPAAAAPPEMYHHFLDPVDLRAEGYTAAGLCLTISVIAVAMRMWTKICLVRKVYLEDCNFTPSLFE